MKIGDKIQSADWKAEKHAPVIECPDEVEAGKPFKVMVSVGKEIPHPNTLEHFIKWIDVYFEPEGSKFVYQVGRVEFAAHGEADIFTKPVAKFALQVNGPGTLVAVSLCNLHGLWEGSAEVKIA